MNDCRLSITHWTIFLMQHHYWQFVSKPINHNTYHVSQKCLKNYDMMFCLIETKQWLLFVFRCLCVCSIKSIWIKPRCISPRCGFFLGVLPACALQRFVYIFMSLYYWPMNERVSQVHFQPYVQHSFAFWFIWLCAVWKQTKPNAKRTKCIDFALIQTQQTHCQLRERPYLPETCL